MIAEAPRLRLIQQLGPDGAAAAIDLGGGAGARRRGLRRAPGVAAPAVAEMTLALMLACLRRLPPLDQAARAGAGWRPPAGDEVLGGEIGGRVVGLVGYDAVAARLAPVLRALGATLLYWDRRPEPEAAATFVPLRELFEASDVVSLHLPLTPETERLVDASALGLMKPGAVLVNTAQGGLVDEAALAEALACGHLRAAGLDAFAAEPLPRDHPLLALDNVVVSPRPAWLTLEALRRALGAGGRERPAAARGQAAAAPGRLRAAERRLSSPAERRHSQPPLALVPPLCRQRRRGRPDRAYRARRARGRRAAPQAGDRRRPVAGAEATTVSPPTPDPAAPSAELGHSLCGGLKADLGVGAVAERLLRRRAAAAEPDLALGG